MRALAAGLLALLAVGCVGQGVPDAELPEAPIAVVYRSPEDSRRHADMLTEQEEKNPARQAQQGEAPSPTGEPPTVARTRDIAHYMKQVLTGTSNEAASKRYPGRLGLLSPRSERIEGVPQAWGESVPSAWSADRSRLLFVALVDDFAQVMELDRTSGEVHPVTHGPEAHPAACYGPGGSYVVMTARPVGDEVQSRIEIFEAGGAGPRALTPGPRDFQPTCAEDGTAVAYVSSPEPGVEEVMVVDPRKKDEAPRRLTPGREPRFCGPGDWIVYSAPIRRGRKLWRVRADGSGRAPVGHGMLDETYPACSPDGSLVVYAVNENHAEGLYVKRIDGSGDRILYSDGDASHPVW